MKEDNKKHKQIKLTLNSDQNVEEYANFAITTHSPAEFVIDFVQVMPGTPKAKVKSRVLLTPQHAKRFMKAMVDNIQKFESVNGAIKEAEAVSAVPMNFGGPTAQA